MSAQRFVICSVARSGTNYFISKMLSTNQLLLAWEPFNMELSTWLDRGELFESLDPKIKHQLRDLELRNNDPEQFYEQVFSPRSTLDLKGISALGFKIFMAHNPRIFAKSVSEKGLKVILLERKNRLASFSSEIIARKKKQYTGSYGGKQPKILFDRVYFQMYMQATDFVFASSLHSLQSSGSHYIHLFYEDFSLVDTPVNEALDFVGIGGGCLASWLVKQNSNDLLARFTNPEAVIKYMNEKELPFLT